MRIYLFLLLLLLSTVRADPAKPTGHLRHRPTVPRQIDPNDRLAVCVDELSRLYQLHDQGKFAGNPEPETLKRDDEDPTLIDQRLKAKTAHVIEALKRARIGHEESCADLEGVINAKRAPADAVRTRQAQKDAEKKSAAALERFRDRPGVTIDPKFAERPDFEYIASGPKGFKAECKSCACMLDTQRRLKEANIIGAALGSSGQLSSQLFRDQTAVVAKEQNMANGNIETYFVYFSPGSGQIARIEHYLF